MQRKGNKLLIQLCSAILLFFTSSWYAFADSGAECYIESSAAGMYVMDISSTPYTVVTRQVTAVEEMSDAVWDVPIVLRGRAIGCKAVSSGDESVHFINSARASLQTGYTAANGAALFKTTVPCIVYSVELLCTTCGRIEDPHINLDLKLLPAGVDNYIPNPDEWYLWEDTDTKWSLRFRLFYTPEFKPTNGVSVGKIDPGEIATWRIGHTGQPTIQFAMQYESLTFYVDQPTCTILALDPSKGNVSGNEIQLGNNYVSEVNTGIAREVPFFIRGDYCYANKVTVKLLAANKPSNNTLIGKSSGSATGVAVKVHSTYNDSKVLLKADGSNTVEYNFADWSNNLLSFPFTAQLVPDGSGNAVGVGTFSGNATFSFTYE